MHSTPYFADSATEPALDRSLRSHVPAQAVMTELSRHAQPGRRGLGFRLLGRSPLPASARSWYVGALGERRVGRLLDGLPAPWFVLHAVPVGKGDTDIDHVVLGPAGVFTINTKHHPGKPVWVAGRTVRVAGQKQPYIPKAEGEARAAAKLLELAAGQRVPVRAVIAVAGAKQLTVREKPKDVHVTTAGRLTRWLLAQPPLLTDADLATLRPLVEQPATWHPAPPQLDAADVLEKGFRSLQLEVRSAQRVRTAWAASVSAAALGVLASAGPAVVQALVDSSFGAP